MFGRWLHAARNDSAIRGGDVDAYEAVVRQYQGMPLGDAAHRLPDVDSAGEVVQLTFIRAFLSN